MGVSHEIAEMVVDPNVDPISPEVCAPCDLNCSVLYRIYFDSNKKPFLQPETGYRLVLIICITYVATSGCRRVPENQELVLLIVNTGNCAAAIFPPFLACLFLLRSLTVFVGILANTSSSTLLCHFTSC
jgi:hypothetical protein